MDEGLLPAMGTFQQHQDMSHSALLADAARAAIQERRAAWVG